MGDLIIKATQQGEIKKLIEISKRAFESDVEVGAPSTGGPPFYTSLSWHIKMMRKNHLYSAIIDDELIGGAVLFSDSKKDSMYIGRIFIDTCYFKQGLGINLMNMIEETFSHVANWYLDTPIWNVRTNNLYKKLGYEENGRDLESIYYKKIIK